ncbi:MAG: beta-N-acetylhexosaminidase [Flavobacteriales bacterium]|nr:beta-N-acetylhexosaminidase [Flavobacteriales bacterium]
MKKFTIPFLSAVLFTVSLNSCAEQKKKRVINFPETDLAEEYLIPKPLEVTADSGGFALDTFTVIYTSSAKGYEEVGKFLAEKIKAKTNLIVPVNVAEILNMESAIYINLSDSFDLEGPEAYQLIISPDSLVLNSHTAEGAFRGIQTIRQLIPEVGCDTLAANEIWMIPTGIINDAPQFEYRGTMLDVARHFFKVEDVKTYIDNLAYYKLNTLHLHLTDDQGWRIEIKSWPKLTEIGGASEVGGGPGGYYTQLDYSEIVRHATANYITIIPEIDMPGHTNAASVAYPILNGNGKIAKVYTAMRVGFSTLDTHKDTVYTFIDDVIREVSALSPGPYFHIGGDESHVTDKEDFIPFINRVEKIVQKHGKRMIGWEEIANAGMDSTSIAQFWRSKKNTLTAVDKGMKVILSPAKKAYLDMKYDEDSEFGLDWVGHVPVDVAYKWAPESYESIPIENILGIEGPLWSETINTISELEYLAFPRIIGFAELGWTIRENRDWEDYRIRLANQTPYLKRMNINYYRSPVIEWKQ